MNLVWLKLIKRILTHKYYVAKYCFQIGLYWQGITHDLSKFSFTEFSRAIKYWDDNISSLANECKILGCGLAGGDWDGVVYPMLQELFANDSTITLYIYKLCNN